MRRIKRTHVRRCGNNLQTATSAALEVIKTATETKHQLANLQLPMRVRASTKSAEMGGSRGHSCGVCVGIVGLHAHKNFNRAVVR